MNNEHLNNRLELLATILLSVATVATAWCAYQSTVWGSEQEFALHEASIVSRQEASLRNEGLLLATVDVQQFLEWVNAYSSQNQFSMEYLQSTFSPSLQKAFVAWAALKPRHNPLAPRHPFGMKEYVRPLSTEANAAHAKYERLMERANNTNTHSEHFTLLTVILASVLFFGGITSNIKNIKTKLALVIGSSVLLIGSVVWLLTIPMIIR